MTYFNFLLVIHFGIYYSLFEYSIIFIISYTLFYFRIYFQYIYNIYLAKSILLFTFGNTIIIINLHYLFLPIFMLQNN